ncbi:ORF21 [Cydia pomonella granulovirus]|uniref:ORF21 n=2 Tax=Cydia pomonella granulosis virus TaxID=28289 RepID=P87581_GVCPM|nr:ORF21 [Cydia pomonella granulovirus]AAB39102.1 ORF21 [Cydia pomonella granulovirus]AIU36670.1 ORF21 orf17L [Cydia pomonella granulovirus]AIU36810.1 ORF21 orf17L [Cydia pomonella granulovirus]AIU36947.1 ORF21 orf17L [Cydia pomonella granulovirus]AIU37089.1 ORF21 orf17L [Cydia pomonella granulovirus]
MGQFFTGEKVNVHTVQCMTYYRLGDVHVTDPNTLHKCSHQIKHAHTIFGGQQYSDEASE